MFLWGDVMSHSFLFDVKQELQKLDHKFKCCYVSALYGLLIFNSDLIKQLNLSMTVSEFISSDTNSYCVNLFKNIIKFNCNLLELDIKSFLKRLYCNNILNVNNLSLNVDLVKKRCCVSSLARSGFIACGSITSPYKAYHIEYILKNNLIKLSFLNLMSIYGINFKETFRRGRSILYLKESEQIEDLLTFIGAPTSALEIINVKILKDFRNKVNRVINCDTANIEKTITASANQIDNILYIKDKVGLEYLKDGLKEVAILRLENDSISLSELAELFPSRLSKSGVYSRLKRIGKIAEQLREKEK